MTNLFLGIDIGGSTTDVIFFDEKRKIYDFQSVDSHLLNTNNIGALLRHLKIDLKSIHGIILTGGKSKFFADIFKNVPLYKVSEIEAIAQGGVFLSGKKEALVVSLGTGICMVSACSDRFFHAGGSSIGGGTLLGLSKLLLNTIDIAEISELAENGSIKNIDLSLKEIIGSGLSNLSPDATASHFAKIPHAKKIKKEDIALGICNLIAKNIILVALLLADKYKHTNIILGGKLLRIKPIKKILQKEFSLVHKNVFIPSQGEYISVLGAMDSFLKKDAVI